MQRDRLLFGLTVVFGGMTALLLLVSVVFREPLLLVVAVPMGAAAYAFWYQSSGALRERIRQTTRRRAEGRARRGSGGFGAGPRAGFEGAGGTGRRGSGARGRRERPRRGAGGDQDRGEEFDPGAARSMRPAEAYRHLGLEAGADERAIRRAYRERVKDAHPDRGGDEAEFRRLTEAYETLLE